MTDAWRSPAESLGDRPQRVRVVFERRVAAPLMRQLVRELRGVVAEDEQESPLPREARRTAGRRPR